MNNSDDAGGERKRPGSYLGADFSVRAAAAVVMAAGALALAWAGGLPFLAFWVIAGVGVVWEWQRLIGGARIWERSALGALALLAASWLASREYGGLAWLALVAGAIGVGAVTEAERRFEAGAGVVYAGVMTVGINLLRTTTDTRYGLAVTLWLFAVVWGTDVMAYIGGRLIGGPKLWPRVSPGKTWSGALVGAVGGALLGVVLALAASPTPVHLASVASLGLLISVASQGGDLLESALKRRAGVKDSSHLIPGHGGLMDRLDGFIVAVAVAVAIGYLRRTEAWIGSGLFM